jgi:uncharacterized protein YjbI with pentapeptide repeats
VSHRAPSILGSTTGRWWCVAALLLGGVLLAGAWLSGHVRPRSVASAAPSRPARATTGTRDLSRLSVQAQSLISSTIGGSEERFAAARRSGGYGLVAGRLTAALGRRGIRIGDGGGHLALRLIGVGRGARLRPLPVVTPSVSAHRVTYAHGGGVHEWYAAGPLGIEQGFTLTRRPPGGSGAVRLALAVGGLRARLRGSVVEFVAPSGRVALRYGGLVAHDARGRRLPAWLSLSRSGLLLDVHDRHARYPLRIDPFIQATPKLTATDETGRGAFGLAIAVSADGNTALIGGPGDDNVRGAAWVFTRSGSTWAQQGPKLTANGESGPGLFGGRVALSADGNTALIGAPDNDNSPGNPGPPTGAAWVFTRSGSTWTQGPKLTAAAKSSFGSSVALSGDGNTALIGAPEDNDGAGTAWVFTNSATTPWAQQGSALTGAGESSGQTRFGESVALSGDGLTALIGGPADNVSTGAAWAFTRAPGSTWNEDGPKLTASDESGRGKFGASVALSGDGHTALIGADNDGTNGAAWIFTRGGFFRQRGPKLVPTDASGQGAEFGTSVALSTDAGTAMIGGSDDNRGVGAAWMFAVGSGAVQVAKLTPTDASGPDPFFGSSVAVSSDGSTALVGADNDNVGVGAAYAFAVKNQFLYWDNPQSGVLGRATLDGEPTNINQRFVTGARQDFTLGVVADRQHVYWTNGGFIARSNLDGTGVNPQFVKLPAGAHYLAVDDKFIYWTNGGPKIGRANFDGTDVNPNFITINGDTFLNGLAVDSSHIYWADSEQKTIGRANLDGTGVNPSFITGVPNVTDVAVDSQHIYWTENTSAGPPSPASGLIGRANLDGTGVNPNFVPVAGFPRGIAVDSAHIYWANYYTCDFRTNPFSNCTGGTIGRADLDGSAVDQAYVTAGSDAGPGCGSENPEIRCGPSTVAVSAPTQPICIRTSLTPAPVPPPGGAAFARPLDPASPDANVVILPAGVSWTGDASCTGVSEGSAQVMTHPTAIEVAPEAAVRLRDQPAGLVSAWGARDVGSGDPAPVLFPGRSDWQTTEADVVAPQQLLTTDGGCPACIVPKTNTFDTLTPPAADPNVAYQGDVSGANLTGLTLTGNFDGWNFSGADLTDATMGGTTGGVEVSGAHFNDADLRGAQLTSLQFTTPPTFTHAAIGGVNGSPPCTTITDTNLVNAQFSDLTADMSGCKEIPLLPGSSAPLGLIDELTVKLHQAPDYSDANFVATAADQAALAGADLQGIDLEGASFLGFPADLEGTNFNGASLTKTSFELADLAKAQFESVVAPQATFNDANLTGATFAQLAQGSLVTNLQQANFVDATVSGASFQTADISKAAFDDALADTTDFNSVSATNTSFAGAHIYGDGPAFMSATDLTGADFDNAILAGAISGTSGFDLTGAKLNMAKFDNAQCIGCNFSGATLDGVSFHNAYLPGAQLSTATLNGASFNGTWLSCGSDSSGDPSDASCTPAEAPQPQWPLALGSNESFGPVVPFTSTTLEEDPFAEVTACPDGQAPSSTDGCKGRLIPDRPPLFPHGPSDPPVPCSAVALDACPTQTSTLFDGTKITDGAPISVVPAAPPTWSSTVSQAGYYVGLKDGTVVESNSPDAVVATSPDPAGLAIGLDGSLYIADPMLHEVRRVDPSSHTITTVAGTGAACGSPTAACGDGGPATAATLSGPTGVWASPSGALFIADGERGIREVLADGMITTIGPMPGSEDIVSVAGDAAGNLYASANDPDHILQVDLSSGEVKTVVGTGTSGYNGGGLGTGVEINHPGALSVALDGNVVFADTDNDLIRVYTPGKGVVDDLAGVVSDGVPQGGFNGDNFPDDTEFSDPAAVTVTRGAHFVVADTGNALLRQIGPNPLPTSVGTTGGSPPPSTGQPPSPALAPTVTTPPPATTPPSGQPIHRRSPNNHFTRSRIRTSRNGTLTFGVKVPGPGTVDVLATAWNDNLARDEVARAAIRLRPAPRRFVYARSRARARRANMLNLRVRPNARGRKLVRHHTYRVTLRLWISYTPEGGRPRTIRISGLHLPR